MRIQLSNGIPTLFGEVPNIASVTCVDISTGISKDYISLINGGTDSIWVYCVRISKAYTVGPTGLVRRFSLRTASGHSGGNLLTPNVLYGAAVPSGVTARDSATVSAVSIIAHTAFAEEETGGGGMDAILWPSSSFSIPLPLAPGSGLVVTNDATAGSGVVSSTIIFGYK